MDAVTHSRVIRTSVGSALKVAGTYSTRSSAVHRVAAPLISFAVVAKKSRGPPICSTRFLVMCSLASPSRCLVALCDHQGGLRIVVELAVSWIGR